MTEEVLFHAVLAQAPADRSAYLVQHCPDPALLAKVEALLAAHDRPAGPLDVPASTGPFEAALPGTLIGPYKLLQQIGQGGMGAVYMAEQTEPVRRMVAIKVIKPGMDSAQVIARFEAERQALALMDHQNIAKVFDAGATPEGRPYFVMELIRGEPITKYCDGNHLTPQERLELFVPVCQAVQHAHQKGVIHRDLKPSNVLVTLYDGRPVPKVIDFGVAKALHQRLTDKTMFTEFGAVVGTLEYMAPEQAELSHLDVDTRSDVYSLGVLLYELLTGSTPLDRKRLRSAAYDEMLRIIREEEPPKPSTRLSDSGEKLASIAAQRRTEPAKLSKLVRGEIDWIVMKALEKDRSRRYETANGFARDLQRYLADEAVEACPPSAGYRVRKFVRRHRAGISTAVLFGFTLVLFAALSVYFAIVSMDAEFKAMNERDRAMHAEEAARAAAAAEAVQRAEAERQRDEAREQRRRTRQALDDMLGDESLAFLTTQTDLLPQQRAFLKRSLGYYREFAADAATDEEGRGLVGQAQFRLGEIYQKLGQWEKAEAAYRSALALREKLVADSPAVPAHRRDLAASHYNLGNLLTDLRRRVEAKGEYRAALEVQTALTGEFPTVPGYRHDLARIHNNLGALLKALDERAAAEGEYREAAAIHAKLVADFPAEPRYRQDLAIHQLNLGNGLSNRGQAAAAEAAYRSALTIQEKLVADFPATPEYRRDLALSNNNLAHHLAGLNRRAEAEAAIRSALALREKLAADFPAVPTYRRDLARSQTDLGDFLAALNRRAEAGAAFGSAIAVRMVLVAAYPSVPEYRVGLARNYTSLGRLLAAQNRSAEAEAVYRSALALLEQLVADFPTTPEYRLDLGGTHHTLANLLADSGKKSAAEAEYHQALAARERLAVEYPTVPAYAMDLGGSYCDIGSLMSVRGEPADAMDWFAKAIATLEPICRDHPNFVTARLYLCNSHRNRAMTLICLHRAAQAVADFDRALQLDDGSRGTALRLSRAGAMAQAGEPARALVAADELAAAGNLAPGQLYDLARVFALVAGMKSRLPTADADRAADRAVAMLRQALAAGYGNVPGDVPQMLKDADLAVLHNRADYVDLLWDLADKAK